MFNSQYKTEYKRYLDLFNEYSEKVFSAVKTESNLSTAMAYSFFAGGKRVRPVLMLAFADILGGDLNKALPKFVCDYLKLGFSKFGKKIAGYDREDVILTGVETRTSAPLRILRTEKYNMLNDPNAYPCAEGAGYAGGIMSAAVDGINVALAILEK